MKYRIELPMKNSICGVKYLGVHLSTKSTVLVDTRLDLTPAYKTIFTEDEINELDYRYKVFAVPIDAE